MMRALGGEKEKKNKGKSGHRSPKNCENFYKKVKFFPSFGETVLLTAFLKTSPLFFLFHGGGGGATHPKYLAMNRGLQFDCGCSRGNTTNNREKIGREIHLSAYSLVA